MRPGPGRGPGRGPRPGRGRCGRRVAGHRAHQVRHPYPGAQHHAVEQAERQHQGDPGTAGKRAPAASQAEQHGPERQDQRHRDAQRGPANHAIQAGQFRRGPGRAAGLEPGERAPADQRDGGQQQEERRRAAQRVAQRAERVQAEVAGRAGDRDPARPHCDPPQRDDVRRSRGDEQLGGDAQYDGQESGGRGDMQRGEQADAALAVPELVIGQSALQGGRRDLPGLRRSLPPVRRPHRLVPPRPAGQRREQQQEQDRHQHPDQDLPGRMTSDVAPAQWGEPPLVPGQSRPHRLVSQQVRADQHRDERRVHRQRQPAQPVRQPVQPEPPARPPGPDRAHPACQVAQQERQQRQPQHPDLAPRGQPAPRIALDVPVHVPAGGLIHRTGAVIARAVEARDLVAAGLLGREVAENGVRRCPADPVHPQFRHALAHGRQR